MIFVIIAVLGILWCVCWMFPSQPDEIVRSTSKILGTQIKNKR